MSITDELRKWAQICGIKYDSKLYEIADNIDSAHRAALEKLAAQVDEGEDGWMRLPVDADGETIHGGDEMCSMNGDVLGRVTGIGVCERTGWVWILRNGRNVSTGCDATTLRHHHVQTVEDVLDEFANAVLGCDNTEESVQRVIAEYAAKLRLAGEGE